MQENEAGGVVGGGGEGVWSSRVGFQSPPTISTFLLVTERQRQRGEQESSRQKGRTSGLVVARRSLASTCLSISQVAPGPATKKGRRINLRAS